MCLASPTDSYIDAGGSVTVFRHSSAYDDHKSNLAVFATGDELYYHFTCWANVRMRSQGEHVFVCDAQHDVGHTIKSSGHSE
jgi:hypothetical protein